MKRQIRSRRKDGHEKTNKKYKNIEQQEVEEKTKKKTQNKKKKK